MVRTSFDLHREENHAVTLRGRASALTWLGRVVAVVALGLAAACSGSVSPAAGVPAASQAANTRPTARSLRVGTSGDYAPFSTWKGDHAEDFAPALLDAFAAEQHTDLTWARFRWPSLVADLSAGRFDLAADGITVRPERSVAGRFTVPIARGGAVLLLRRPPWAEPKAPLVEAAATATAMEMEMEMEAALAALRGLDRPALRVAVNHGGHLERVARSLLRSAEIRALPDNDAVPAALARGEVDAALTTTFEAPRWAQGIAGVERVGPLTQDVIALWVRADEPDLATRLDTFLLAAEESGALGRLRARYLGAGVALEKAALPLDALLCATAERLALMPFVAAAKRRTGQAVEDPAQEARVLATSRAAVAAAAAARSVAPPPGEAVDTFFRAQIDAAKAVQQHGPIPDAPAFSLDELRPAVARITARMAFLLVRLPHGLARASAIAEARAELAGSGLEPGEIESLAGSLVTLAP
jgi:cyclohexadienyl dehydratase